ncbi:Uma2 family endonuclease [Paludisphaera rhizosphaerae]|uniref:Uma2 family endonuclease n=1 Tax=Paludisphaera rhizosphaerae TaxID=2711216 RepID=UPI0013EB0F46|nr:Uma2 family endonuclease [Paludisphaera rhizosphaerae]
MSTAKPDPRPAPEIVLLDPPFWDAYDPRFPDSDGKPMADSTIQYRWMVTIAENLEELFEDRLDVLVACDLLWYFDQTNPKKCIAPDVFVAFGRPKAHRHSYKEWIEGHAPEVVFEIHSPSNTARRMREKQEIYDERGVEEYYYYDPETGRFQGWLRGEGGLESIEAVDSWTSPRLGVTFEPHPGKEALVIRRPNGEAFQHVQDIMRDRRVALRAAKIQRRRRREAERRADLEHERAQTERRLREEADHLTRAERQRAETERQRAETERLAREEADAVARAERERADRLAAKLRELGIDPE